MTDAAAHVTAAQAGSPLLDALRQIVGNDHVLTGDEDRRYFSSDVYREAEPAEVRLRPGTLDSDPGTKPAAHVFVSFKAPWTTLTDALPQHG